MRIAQVAPLYESVPPRFYGGTERVVSYLTEELVLQGYDVTLFASGDSITSADLIAACRLSLRLDRESIDPIARHLLMVEEVFKERDSFDIIHFHIDYLHFPLCRRYTIPTITTLHGRLDIPDIIPLFQEFCDIPVVSISDSQREPLPWLDWQGTVYHGLPIDLYTFRKDSGKYLAFLGRISPEKRVDRAIEIANCIGMEIRIAAKVDEVDREYFENIIRPLLKSPFVKFVGEIGENDKEEFIGNAYALIFPIDWPEPFGLVMIESMACGTPIVAYRSGSVPEVIEDGAAGYIVESLDDAIKAVKNISSLSRKKCRQVFERRFTAFHMTRNYLELYKHLVKTKEKEMQIC